MLMALACQRLAEELSTSSFAEMIIAEDRKPVMEKSLAITSTSIEMINMKPADILRWPYDHRIHSTVT